MNNNLICKMYKDGKSMREIAVFFNTNHHIISRILKKENVEKRQPKNLRGKKKFKNNKELLYNNMAIHLRFIIDYRWLMKFEDFDKLKFLNRCITNRSGRFNIDSEWYIEYIEKFYIDKQFNYIYKKWIDKRKNKWFRPTIDHITPVSRGGNNDLNNLQFLTWFENRCKTDIDNIDWLEIKKNINEFFIDV